MHLLSITHASSTILTLLFGLLCVCVCACVCVCVVLCLTHTGGGGAGYALWLDGNLCSGTSMPCDTFGNSCLASSSKFDILEVELWGLSL
eukprot:COSAG06_NODE_24559_length_659_cov_0.876786_2_plen_90_part_00